MSKYLILFRTTKTPFFLPLTAVRIAIGLFFFASGFNKVFVPENKAIMLETIIDAGIFYPAFMAVFVASCEALFGLLLTVGLFTRLSAMVLALINLVALFTVGLNHIPDNINFISWYSWLFYLPESPYILICIMLIIQGGGPWSIDREIIKRFYNAKI